MADRHRVHSHTVEVCKDVLRRRPNIEWDSMMRDELRGCSIRKVDLVVTIGGDGTLLQASNCLDDSIPILGVNSDPTITSEARFLLSVPLSQGMSQKAFLYMVTVKEPVGGGILINTVQLCEGGRELA